MSTKRKENDVLFCVVDAKTPHVSQVNVRVSLRFHSFIKSRFGVFSCAFSPAGVFVFLFLFSRK